MIKDDPILQSFLTEPSLEEWRRHTSISYDEESTGKRVDRIEEMAIPSDLEDKLAYVMYLVYSSLVRDVDLSTYQCCARQDWLPYRALAANLPAHRAHRQAQGGSSGTPYSCNADKILADLPALAPTPVRRLLLLVPILSVVWSHFRLWLGFRSGFHYHFC